ncbi:hypothetical protein [Streptomyces sp. NPDC085937]|uniref:hypothetical protein n=1 Tax=Streptomyces sp. NPDC085937 TaxID=3365742 RepID=UPI0037CD1301
MSDVDQMLNALYATARTDREAHHARILRELDATTETLTENLLPPEWRAAGLRFVYETEEAPPMTTVDERTEVWREG